MTQHIKTHFKERGINSLTANSFNLLNGSGSTGSPSVINENGTSGGADDDISDQNVQEEEEDNCEEEEEEIEPC